MNKKVIFRDIGLIDYKEAWDYQETLFNKITDIKLQNRNLQNSINEARSGNENNSDSLPAQQLIETPNYLIFCEHPHVYTLGNSGAEKHLLINQQQLVSNRATYYKTNRGGDITYHGPGQLVAYPILDLDNFFTDIHQYLRFLEETIILTLAEYGIAAGRTKGQTGVWLDENQPGKARKICAMGIRASRWVTMHGLAFNVNSDLSYFNHIIPCGISDKAVTSLDKELDHKVDMVQVKEKLQKHFSSLFQAELIVEKIAAKIDMTKNFPLDKQLSHNNT